MSLVSRYLDPALMERLNFLQLSARRVVAGSTIGIHKSRIKGASIEFRQHRSYVVGDEPRRIDWRVLGRTDRPYVKEYDEETNLRCLVLLDGSGSMAYKRMVGSKFDYAATLSASLICLMLQQAESAGLGIFRQRIDSFVLPRNGMGQLANVIDALEHNAPHGASDLATSLHNAGNRLERRSLIVVVSDLLTPIASFREGIAHLKHDRHEVICLRVLDRDEIEFPFQRWARLDGLEGERPMLLEPALARKSYLRNFRRHNKELEDLCHTQHVELHTFASDQSLGDAMSRFLRGRNAVADVLSK